MTGTGCLLSLSLSLSLSLFPFLFLSSQDSIFEEKQHHVSVSRLGGPEIELQVTVCRARRASELSRGMRVRLRNSHIRTGTHIRVRNVRTHPADPPSLSPSSVCFTFSFFSCLSGTSFTPPSLLRDEKEPPEESTLLTGSRLPKIFPRRIIRGTSSLERLLPSPSWSFLSRRLLCSKVNLSSMLGIAWLMTQTA